MYPKSLIKALEHQPNELEDTKKNVEHQADVKNDGESRVEPILAKHSRRNHSKNKIIGDKNVRVMK